MGKSPVKPNFIKEYNEEKEVKQTAPKQNNPKESVKVVDNSKSGSNKKLIIPIAIAVLLICVIGGAFIFKAKSNSENNNQRNNSNSQVADVSKQVAEEKSNSDEGLYQKEAEALWKKYHNQFTCNEHTFKTKYVGYRTDSLSSAEAYAALENEYGKVLVRGMDIIGTDEVDATEENIEVEEETVSENTVSEDTASAQVVEKEPEIKQVPTSEPVENTIDSNTADDNVIVDIETNPEYQAPENEAPSQYHEEMWSYDEGADLEFDADWGGNIVNITDDHYLPGNIE